LDYTNITIHDVFLAIYDYSKPEESYLEAQNIMDFRELLCLWFKMIEDGRAEKIYPDFSETLVTLDLANLLINEIEDDCLIELPRAMSVNGTTKGPGFTRLNDHAKIAFAQQVFSLIKSPEQITKEIEEKHRNHEVIIPENLSLPAYYDYGYNE